MKASVIVTAEHASNAVPPKYQRLFRGHRALLQSHRGWDPGSTELARGLARAFGAPLFLGEHTRLLVDLNRSLHHRALLSTISRQLSADERATVIARHWQPFRDAVAQAVARSARPVFHLSAHSFTPVLDGRARTMDLGILYDPSRPAERRFAAELVRTLAQQSPALIVRRNAPYRGVADGHVTALRRQFAVPRYAGVELELSQRHVRDRAALTRIVGVVVRGVQTVVRR